MYDEHTVNKALEMLASGMGPRAVSRALGGRSSATAVARWASGGAPGG